ncbi:hypothetical protein ZHAS_00019056 [Anopheles sinensis]|uniref:Uncharacterized protein n=1 Tax=Anopheles sinensis TaxID=74873 RepID=A0A084WLB5_ANOSI|nr:hypothetical protein ZHAS_00019056 [Anopheles sinensis]
MSGREKSIPTVRGKVAATIIIVIWGAVRNGTDLGSGPMPIDVSPNARRKWWPRAAPLALIDRSCQWQAPVDAGHIDQHQKHPQEEQQKRHGFGSMDKPATGWTRCNRNGQRGEGMPSTAGGNRREIIDLFRSGLRETVLE